MVQHEIIIDLPFGFFAISNIFCLWSSTAETADAVGSAFQAAGR